MATPIRGAVFRRQTSVSPRSAQTRSRVGRTILLTATLIGVAASGASARSWIASPSGDEDGTIAEILLQVGEGDSVRLQSGEHLWPGDEVTTSLSLIGDLGASVGGASVSFANAASLEFHDISFHLRGFWSIRGSRRVLISGCEFFDFRWQIRFVSIDTLEILDSLMRDNDPPAEFQPPAMFIAGSQLVRLEGCTFARNRSRAGAPWDESGGGGGALAIEFVERARVRKCGFVSNEAVSGAALHCRTQGLIFEQNTVVGNRSESGSVVVHAEGDDVVIRQNVFAGSADFALWIGDEQGVYVPRVYCNAFWENNSIGIGDFGERENRQWRAILALGRENEDDYYSVHADPYFCSDSLTVGEASVLASPPGPCAPIGGAYEIGCGLPPPVRKTSWGQLKQVLGK